MCLQAIQVFLYFPVCHLSGITKPLIPVSYTHLDVYKRQPVTRGEGTRVELRSPDAASNPYLVFAVCLAAGLDGIRNKISPAKSSNIANQDQAPEHLPETLKDAIELFENSEWIRGILGEDFCKTYL